MVLSLPIELLVLFFSIATVFLAVGFIFRKVNGHFAGLYPIIGGALLIFIIPLSDNLIMGYSDGSLIDIQHYFVITNTANVAINSVTPIRAEYPTTSSSQLIGDVIDCMTVPLIKVGTPNVNTLITAGVFTTDGSLVKAFGTLNVTNVSTGFFFYEFCLPDGEHYTVGSLPSLVERFGVKYTGGDASNRIDARSDGNNPYDSTITTLATFTTATGLWTTTTGSDFTMILTGSGQTPQEIHYSLGDENNTNGYVAVVLAIFGAMYIFIGAMMQKYD